jgi:hypothetical protein
MCLEACPRNTISNTPVVPPSSPATQGSLPQVSLTTAPVRSHRRATSTAYTARLSCMASAAKAAWCTTRRCCAGCHAPPGAPAAPERAFAASAAARARLRFDPPCISRHSHAHPGALHFFARGCFACPQASHEISRGGSRFTAPWSRLTIVASQTSRHARREKEGVGPPTPGSPARAREWRRPSNNTERDGRSNHLLTRLSITLTNDKSRRRVQSRVFVSPRLDSRPPSHHSGASISRAEP